MRRIDKLSMITLYLLLAHYFILDAQLALHVEQPNAVLFGSDTSGQGDKFMWLPSKAALRAGGTNSTDWDYDNIGRYSFATGYSPSAWGDYSMALGYFANAWDENSVAIGPLANARAIGTIAIGERAYARGGYSIAIGHYSEANGLGAFALGEESRADGQSSMAIGRGARAAGVGSTAIGWHTVAECQGCMAIGRFNEPSDATFDVGVGKNLIDRRSALSVYHDGNVRVGRPGEGNKFLEFNSERSWAFVQHSTGGTTALKLQCDPGNNNKNFIIDTEGKVGINVDQPTYKLELPNASHLAAGQARAYDWDTYSDARVKRNVQMTTYGLEEILALQPVSYDHHSAKFDRAHGLQVAEKEYNRELGFIAQEVYEVIPEAVSKPEDENENLWSMSYMRLIPVLTKAVQEQQQEILRLQEELDMLHRLMTGN